MISLHAIEEACAAGLVSGLSQVSFVDPQDLSISPRWGHEPTLDQLIFNSGKAAFFVGYRFGTARISDKVIDSPAGQIFEYSISLFAGGTTPEAEYMKAKMRNRRVHVVAKYMDDKQRLIPLMKFTPSGDSGDSSTRRGNTFTGSVRLLKPAPFLSETLNIIGPPYVPPTDPGGGSGGAGGEVIELVTTNNFFIYNVPAGRLLVAIFVVSTADQYIRIGYSAGGSDLAGPFEMYAGVKAKFGDNFIIPSVDTNIYFADLQGTNSIQICLL